MKRVTRSAIVEHSADDMYRLVEDIESYPSFLPWCLAARVHERGVATTRATLTVGMPGLRQSFTTRNENRPGQAIDMNLVAIAEGDYVTVPLEEIGPEISVPPEQMDQYLAEMEEKMREAARKFDFKQAAAYRDRVKELRTRIVLDGSPA